MFTIHVFVELIIVEIKYELRFIRIYLKVDLISLVGRSLIFCYVNSFSSFELIFVRSSEKKVFY